MKWLFGILVLINAGVALWAVAHKNLLGSEQDPARPPIAPDGMRLVEPAPRAPVGPAPVALCFRIGPFFNPEQLMLAGQKLDGLGVPFSQRNVGARQIRAFRVFLGPYAAVDTAQSVEERLAAAGIADHYVKQDGETGPIVSLGLFSQQDSAKSLHRELEDKGFGAEIRIEDRTLDPTYWLELKDATANRGSGDALTVSGWGDKRARLREIRCDL
ncbi:MAG: hypothetical protein OES09_02335 [Gammaproteobacteria bacterium]|nr:hypothetical protein [Gammaproteobacteria bacterium]